MKKLTPFIVKWESVMTEYDSTLINDWEADNNTISFWHPPIDEIRETVIHELLHVILEKYYYTHTSAPILSRRQEEQLVNILANELDNNRKNIIKITKELKEIL